MSWIYKERDKEVDEVSSHACVEKRVCNVCAERKGEKERDAKSFAYSHT
jgi:hypothetical protein